MLESKTDGVWEGYTENYTRVKVCAPEAHDGDIIRVKLTSVKNDYCIGELAE